MFLSAVLLLLSPVACLSNEINEQLGIQQTPLRNFHEDTYSNPLERKDFETYVSEVLDELHTPGISLAVIHKNETWTRAFGYSDLTSQRPLNSRDLFFAGSTTKSFTAALASKLVYSNESQYADIKWSTKLADLIRDDFVLWDEYATNHVTLVDALSHRTGMPRHDMSWMNGNPSIREQVRQMRHLPLHNEIRTEWEYCNLMFTAVSHALEVIIGEEMFKILREWIWEPLGMQETFYRLQDALQYAEKSGGKVAMARSYLWDNETREYVAVPFTDIPPSNGAGGIITNVWDYTHWIRQFLYPSNDSKPIDPRAVEDMTAAHMPIPPNWMPFTTHVYGLGLETATYRGYHMVGHSGAIAGYMTLMYWFPELEWGFISLQNSYSFAGLAVQYRLVDEFLDSVGAHGSPYDIRSKVRQLEQEMAARLEDGKERVYPGAPDQAPIAPSLPFREYVGTYSHPAYHNITLSAHCLNSTEVNGGPVWLVGRGSRSGFLNMTWTFRHASGERWWVRSQTGPASFITDELLKAMFEVDVRGKVTRLGLQAEKSIDEFAWFEKVA